MTRVLLSLIFVGMLASVMICDDNSTEAPTTEASTVNSTAEAPATEAEEATTGNSTAAEHDDHDGHDHDEKKEDHDEKKEDHGDHDGHNHGDHDVNTTKADDVPALPNTTTPSVPSEKPGAPEADSTDAAGKILPWAFGLLFSAAASASQFA